MEECTTMRPREFEAERLARRPSGRCRQGGASRHPNGVMYSPIRWGTSYQGMHTLTRPIRTRPGRISGSLVRCTRVEPEILTRRISHGPGPAVGTRYAGVTCNLKIGGGPRRRR